MKKKEWKTKLSAIGLSTVIFSAFIPNHLFALTPSIHFYSTVNGQNIAMADNQIVTKDSQLKLYFHAENHMTIEYKGYLYDQDTGQYDDLKIGGAFTGGVEDSFVGMKLSNTKVMFKGAERAFKKGDVIVFKFRVVSEDGHTETREMKALIGDALSDIGVLDTIVIP